MGGGKSAVKGAWKNKSRDFPGGPVMEAALPLQEAGVLIPGEGTKAPHALEAKRSERGKRKKKTQTSRYGIRGRQGRLWLTLTNLLSGALRSGHRRLHPDIKFKTGERNLGTTDF